MASNLLAMAYNLLAMASNTLKHSHLAILQGRTIQQLQSEYAYSICLVVIPGSILAGISRIHSDTENNLNIF